MSYCRARIKKGLIACFTLGLWLPVPLSISSSSPGLNYKSNFKGIIRFLIILVVFFRSDAAVESKCATLRFWNWMHMPHEVK
jgi:hypothetical protein